MNAQASRKLIVVGAMAVVVAIGVTTFAMRPHTVSQVAQATTPPVPLADSSAVEEAVPVARVAPAAPAPDAPIEAAPVTPAHKDIVVIKRATVRTSDSVLPPAVVPKVAAARPAPAPDTTTPAYSDTVKPVEAAPDLSMQAAAAAVANASEPASAVAADRNPQASTVPAASDSEITANVKSAIAADGLGQGTSIGVVTTNGVVALTGNASPDVIDHIRLVVASVKDVKSVDTSALSVPAS